MLKKKDKNIRIKTYFIILNLIFATIAINFLIGSADATGACPVGGNCGASTLTPSGGSALTPSGQTSMPNPAGVGTPNNPSGVGGQYTYPGSGQVPTGAGDPNLMANQFGNNAGGSAAALQNGGSGAAKGQVADANSFNFGSFLGLLAGGVGLGMTIGSLAGGKNGAMWGAIAGGAGVAAYQIAVQMGASQMTAGLIGIAVFLVIFLLTYKKESQKPIEFQCLPWQAPMGGKNCEMCNKYSECSEYSCKSYGQACDLVNKGQKNQKCVWKDPMDTNSPTIEMTNVSLGHHFVPDTTIRPPATGVQILKNGGKCIKAFTPLTFTIKTNEPSQCKIDYNMTTYSADQKKGLYDNMGYYMGGDSSFDYNHTDTLSLPGPDAINAAAAANSSGVILHNDGTYTLYIRCEDANGNFDVDPFSVKFCVDKGPDTTPPLIENYSIPSGNPVQFNLSSLSLDVYVNEPADCKWSHEIKDYDHMEYNLSCANQMWEMNNFETYTCRANLTGILSDQDNVFYFRCLDQPYMESGRNPNMQSYEYHIIGTRPLNIMEFSPSNETISAATDVINVTLSVTTDNGYNNGEALCYYSNTGDEKDYVEFSDTGNSVSTQRQDLIAGDYTYYFKCVDLGGNAAYNSTQFSVESDKTPPFIIRAYKESSELKIITDENAECSYSFADCNFEIDDGIKMSSVDYTNHNAEWKPSKNYFIRCKDKYDNQPNPNTCSIILRPFDIYGEYDYNSTIQI